MFATLLIGLREGLETALVVAMLIAYLTKIGRRDVLPRLWLGVGLAVALAVVVGAVLTFGAYSLTFQAQEIIGGSLSLVTVALVTWMVFWMQKTAKNMRSAMQGGVDRALAGASLWGIVVIGFVSVAREGIETTLLLWSMVQSFGNTPDALLGALVGLAIAVAAGWLLAKGLLRINLQVFFAWTGVVLVIAAAGVLAYALKDLQEAGVVPGPFTAGAPVDPATGAVAVGLSALPLGWAFDLTAVIAPGGTLATLLQATVGFMPRMSWIQVIAWVGYLAVVGAFFVRGQLRARRPRPQASTSSSSSVSSSASAPAPAPAPLPEGRS
ncbi:iron uptake transporter permease EfeU [Microbacterium sp. CJ88]|uniref:iron uptake transporter permease EfeU n=1 Tax=Microbacterium sp. CJ88 TaxID=3445672 RepID=UPI003F65B8A2